MLKIAAIMILLFFSSPILAASPKTFGNVIVAEVTSVYDGDTFRCNVPEYPPIIGERISIRINGIDTPEMRDNRPAVRGLARQAKQYIVQRLREGRKIELRNMQRDKYFRILADVYVDGSSLARELIDRGLAKPYEGGRKTKW